MKILPFFHKKLFAKNWKTSVFPVLIAFFKNILFLKKFFRFNNSLIRTQYH